MRTTTRDVPPPPPPNTTTRDVPPPPPPPPPPEDAGDADADAEMMAMMGFAGFGTTAGKHVDDPNANASAVNKKSVRRARQYMNRPGGFNRPLPEEKTGVRQNRI
jgi:U4/U6.U5 tri-snRNP-associated protein 3